VDRSIVYIREHRLIWTIMVSVLLHLLLLLFYPRWGKAILFPSNERVQKVAEKRIAFEIIETPEYSRIPVPPDKAELWSDKNALSRDMLSKTMGSADRPYREGDIDARVLPQSMADPLNNRNAQSAVEQQAPPDEIAEEAVTTSPPSVPRSKFSPEVLLGRQSEASSNQSPSSRQKEASAKDVGGISFNTYAWEFAPYILYLKRLVQRNIYPPPAFTHLGFGGVNVLRFRIYPDGRLEGLEILDHDGVKALIETSRKAIEVSAPFKPLPEKFPERYLEVTAKFQYYVVSKN
jgi:hypothetical protein